LSGADVYRRYVEGLVWRLEDRDESAIAQVALDAFHDDRPEDSIRLLWQIRCPWHALVNRAFKIGIEKFPSLVSPSRTLIGELIRYGLAIMVDEERLAIVGIHGRVGLSNVSIATTSPASSYFLQTSFSLAMPASWCVAHHGLRHGEPLHTMLQRDDRVDGDALGSRR
jgi:hypothetical protein